jgi:hypothetical protein
MIKAYYFNCFFDTLVSSLSSSQRLKALRLFNEDFGRHDSFIIICGVMLAVLIMIFIIVTLLDSIKRKRNSNRLFIESADKRGLNIRERHILMDIAIKARLRLAESIFTMGDVFDRGATQMVRATLAKQGAGRSRYLSAELSLLREKLGFRKKASVTDLALKTAKQGSRQIPEGRKLYITSLDTSEFFDVETSVTENNMMELSVQLTQPLECEPGDSLCARYYFGAPVWEFDTVVLRIKDNILVLQHSDNIRYVNRRRFLRVAVNEPAYIAAFPFARDIPNNKKQGDENSSNESFWGPPKFVPADVTELAGPGLRITAPMEVKVGDRVAVILRLTRDKLQDFELPDNETNKNSRPSRIIEDIGIVKHTEAIEKGFSIAVELTGLNESNVSEMVKTTNEAFINNGRIKDILPVNKEKSTKWEYISETVIG